MRRCSLSDKIRLTRTSKRRAREILDADHNRLWLIGTICVWLAAAGMIYLLGGSLVYAADESVFTEQPSVPAMMLVLASYAFMLFSTVFALVPLGVGVVHVSYLIYSGESICGGDLFAAFRSPRQYVRFMIIGAYGLLRPVLSVLILLIALIVSTGIVHPLLVEWTAIVVLADLAVVCILAVAGLLSLAVLYFGKNSFLIVALMLRGMSLCKAKKYGRVLLKSTGYGFTYYHASFAGWWLLSVLTVGAVAVVDTLPYSLLSHQCVCDALISQKNQQEN